MNKETMKIGMWLDADPIRVEHVERMIKFAECKGLLKEVEAKDQIKLPELKRLVNMSIATGQQWA